MSAPRHFALQQRILLGELTWASAAYYHVKGELPATVQDLEDEQLILFGPARADGTPYPRNGSAGWDVHIGTIDEMGTASFLSVTLGAGSAEAKPFLLVTPLVDAKDPALLDAFGTDRSWSHARAVVFQETLLILFEHHLGLEKRLPVDLPELESTFRLARLQTLAVGSGTPASELIEVRVNRAENAVWMQNGSRLQYVSGPQPCLRSQLSPAVIGGSTEVFFTGSLP